MLSLELLVFAALAPGTAALVWFTHGRAARQSVQRYTLVLLASWLLSSALLFAGLAVVAPNDPALYFPTLAAGQSLPVLLTAAVLALVPEHWSRERRLWLAISMSAGLGFGGPMFLLAATCAIQSNCL